MKKNFKLLMLTLIMGGGLFASEAMALDKVGDVYQIGRADQLIEFAEIVKGGTTNANAVLTADIDMSGVNNWTPIGQDQRDYKGHFNGQGHRILNLKIDNTYDNQALFGQAVDGAIIENVIIDASCSIKGRSYPAGILGHVWGDGVIVRNCGNEANITAAKDGNNEGGQNAAGIVGCSEKKVYISNCYNTGTITGDRESAGICAWMGSSESTIANCYSTGEVIATGNNQGGSNKVLWRKDEVQESNVYCIFDGQGTKIDDKQLTNGYLCFQLNNNSETIWHQAIGIDNHPYPFNRGDNSSVYKYGENIYSNINGDNKYSDGYFQISNASDLVLFAGMINGGNGSANAKLTTDIDFSQQGVMIGYADEDGKRYKGHFDGQGHTVTVGYDRSEKFAALFGVLGNGAIVENLRTAGTITTSNQHAAGIAGGARGNAQIRNCISAVAITGNGDGDGTHAGICGFMHDNGSITNCAFVGSLTAENCTGNAGLLGYANGGDNIVLTNCYVYADFKYKSEKSESWAMKRNTSSLTNCYYIEKTKSGNFQIVNDMNQLANKDSYADATVVGSGELCYKLNGESSDNPAWHQTIGTDAYPVPFGTGHMVVYAHDNVYSNIQNKSGDYYQIANADDLESFAELVKRGNTTIKAKFTDDINMTDVSSDFHGIGIDDASRFKGEIDGQNHKITNWNVSAEDRVGLIRTGGGGLTLKNITIANSCSFAGTGCSAAFVADMNGTGGVTLLNLGNEAAVTGGKNAGGIVGCNWNGDNVITMTNCYNTGAISATEEGGGLGGWLGNKALTTNCYNMGTVTNGESFARGDNIRIKNCYALTTNWASIEIDGVQYDAITSHDVSEFSDGTILKALHNYNENGVNGSVWQMELGDDNTSAHPVLYNAAKVLDEDFQNVFTVDTENSVDVFMTRSVKTGGWNTVCLPFNMDATAIISYFGNGTKVAKIDKTKSADGETIHFTTVTEIEAGQAYLVYPGVTANFTGKAITGVTIAATVPSDGLTQAGFSFQGVFNPTVLISTEGQEDRIVARGTSIVKTSGGTLKGFRAYFHPTGSNARATRFVVDDDETTGIITPEGEVIVDGPVYNLSGQKMNQVRKGLYIVNGKKVVIK